MPMSNCSIKYRVRVDDKEVGHFQGRKNNIKIAIRNTEGEITVEFVQPNPYGKHVFSIPDDGDQVTIETILIEDDSAGA